jgi:hypothetical protein
VSKKRTYYCRVCGSDNGHNFPACKNLTGMRAMISDQDFELTQALGRAKEAEDKLEQNMDWKENTMFNGRVIAGLLDGIEAMRKVNKP